MRRYFVCLFMLIVSDLHAQKGQEPKNILSSEISLEISLSQSMDINLSITNGSKEPLWFSSPQCWTNIILELKDEAGVSIDGIRVRPDLKCSQNFILIRQNQNGIVPFSYKLNEVYPHLASGNYTVEVKYVGNIKSINDKQKRLIGNLESKAIYFVK